MSSIPRLPQEELVFKRKREKFGFKLFKRLKQKNNVWEKNIVQKLKNPGNVLVDGSSATLSADKA